MPESPNYPPPPGRHGAPISPVMPAPSRPEATVSRQRPPSSFDFSPVLPETVDAPHGHSLKKKFGAIAVAGLATLGAFGAFKTGQGSEEVQPVTTSQEASTADTSVERARSIIELHYEESKAVEQSTPFAMVSEPGKERVAQQEQATMTKILESHQAEFMTATQLSSGIKVNLYTSKLDDKREPLSVDVRALDVMVNELISQAGTIENSPISNQIEEIQALAAKGQIKLKLDVVLVSDEKLCLTRPDAGDSAGQQQLAEKTDLMVKQGRCSGGVNGRAFQEDPSAPSLNQFVMALDNGEGFAKSYYSPELIDQDKILPPDQMTAVTISHEFGHALVGLTNQNGVLGANADSEHEQFVNPLESKMFGYYCDLSADPSNNVELITPVHVENVPAIAGK
ncbi:MAG: hypothetical protein ABIQ89_01450 [Candidatus Saccharimonadales bacterium]